MLTRRSLLAGLARAAKPRSALIAMTVDLEMARHYPTWDQTEWDYEKGNLTAEVKEYSRQTARRVRAKDGIIHFFAVGRVFEQPDVSWLEEIAREGHPIGNHTYDHVNIRATTLAGLQPRFRRAPWLVEGMTPLDAIARNIRMTSQAIRARLGVEPAGFRSPGGFPQGLDGYEQVQRVLLGEGFPWASTKYVGQKTGIPPYDPKGGPELEREPARDAFDSILESQAPSQPSVYPSGLIEIPMSPISDLIAFRTAHWKLDYFLKAVKETVQHAVERRFVYVLLAHPSCLSVHDPKFRTFELICDLVREARGRAKIASLDEIAKEKRHEAA
jgi:peptidoglycan/xylan/chitin deacetylase (PgdA/CDA1 family)